MGCCLSSLLQLKKPSADDDGRGHAHPHAHANNSIHQNHHHQNEVEAAPPTGDCAPSFLEFSFADLKAATNNFSSDHIVSEICDKASNVVYRGRLQTENNLGCIAVKKFSKAAWPDAKQFAVSTLCSSFSISRVLIWCLNPYLLMLLSMNSDSGGSIWCGEIEKQKTRQFNRVLLRGRRKAACCGIHAQLHPCKALIPL